MANPRTEFRRALLIERFGPTWDRPLDQSGSVEEQWRLLRSQLARETRDPAAGHNTRTE